MKIISLISIIALSISTTFAVNLNFKSLVGTYQITSKQLPVTNTVTIHEDGKIILIERTLGGKLQCEGDANINDLVINSEMTCENGLEFTQEINLENVESFNKFSAPVFSSLFGASLEMDFVKTND